MKTTTYLSPVLAAAVAVGLVASLAAGAADKSKPLSVSEVMKQFHKGDDALCKKVAAGKASKEELKKIVAGYADMAKAEAPKGDAKEWKERTTKLLAAAKEIEAGKSSGLADYKTAVNCKGCHSAHKPD